MDQAAAEARAGRLDAAAVLYERAARADPADFRASMSLGTIELQRGRLVKATAWFGRAAASAPHLFEAHHNLGAAAQSVEEWRLAASAYRDALAVRPGAQETRRNLAVVLAVLGRIDEAEAEHRRLAAEPASRLWALTRLALLKPGALSAAEVDELRGAAADPAADDETRTGAWFAVGEALERRGDDEAAFAAFAEGNRRRRSALATGAPPGGRPEDLLAAHAEAAGAMARRFTPAFLAAHAGEGLATDAPIYIVGMPRSGSTLIEQILGAHPHVLALGETAVLPALLETDPLGSDLGRGDLRALGRRYLESARQRGWRGAGRFVDKTLENYLHVGAIALMFPNATILHAVRDPVDTCLSCYRQLFPTGGETLNDLAEIGAEYTAYRRLMDHWSEVMPGRIADVENEALAAEPERVTRWLIETACRLPWNDAVLRFHEQATPARTASAAQVRQPISAVSSGRWRRYERHLGPLLGALGPYAPARSSS